MDAYLCASTLSPDIRAVLRAASAPDAVLLYHANVCNRIWHVAGAGQSFPARITASHPGNHEAVLAEKLIESVDVPVDAFLCAAGDPCGEPFHIPAQSAFEASRLFVRRILCDPHVVGFGRRGVSTLVPFSVSRGGLLFVTGNVDFRPPGLELMSNMLNLALRPAPSPRLKATHGLLSHARGLWNSIETAAVTVEDDIRVYDSHALAGFCRTCIALCESDPHARHLQVATRAFIKSFALQALAPDGIWKYRDHLERHAVSAEGAPTT